MHRSATVLALAILGVAVPAKAENDSPFRIGINGSAGWHPTYGFHGPVDLSITFPVGGVHLGFDLAAFLIEHPQFDTSGSSWIYNRSRGGSQALASFLLESKHADLSLGVGYDWQTPELPLTAHLGLDIRLSRLFLGGNAQVSSTGLWWDTYLGVNVYQTRWLQIAPVCESERVLGIGCGINSRLLFSPGHASVNLSATWLPWEPERQNQFDPASFLFRLSLGLHS